MSTAIDLVRAMGWLGIGGYLDSPIATPAQLTRFHDPEYVRAVMDAERDGRLDPARRERFNIGRFENPIFPEVFSRPATASGAAILAARLLTPEADGGGEGAGGRLHPRPAAPTTADPIGQAASAISTTSCSESWRCSTAASRRVYYVDIDAHHGDGVQDAFHDDDRVLTVSVHEGARWPFSGAADDRAGGLARNLPVPAGFNDSEMAAIRDRLLLPLGEAFAPEAVVIQCGADAVADDPLSKLAAVEPGALGRGGGAAAIGAPADRHWRRGLQSVDRRSRLGRRLGDPGRCRSGRAADPGRQRGAARPDLAPGAGAQPAGALVHHDRRSAPSRFPSVPRWRMPSPPP